MKNKLRVKWNSGMGAILCSKCSVILKTWSEFTDDEKKAFKGELDLPGQYCNKCK